MLAGVLIVVFPPELLFTLAIFPRRFIPQEQEKKIFSSSVP
jgi:hypothetical protein